MKTSTICCAFIAAVTLLCVAAPASAVPVPLFTFGAGQPVNNSPGNFNIGNEFVTGQGLDVTGIGARVAPTQIVSGLLTKEYNAYLYSSTLTLLASAVIPVGTPVGAQGFVYVPLNYTLSPATHYYLTSHTTVADNTSNYSYAAAATSAGTWGLGSSFVRNRYASGGFGVLNSTNGGFMEFMGGNLLVDVIPPPPVPEPASALLLGLGLVGLARVTRGRRIDRAIVA